jgi:putative ABC transport system permease protein
MRTGRLVRHGFRDMARHRLRTFFMMLGTFVGVLALILVVAIGRGTRDTMISRIDKIFSGSSILLSASGGGSRGGPHSAAAVTTLTIDDLEAIQASIPTIKVWDPMLLAGSREVVYQGNSITVRVMGHSTHYEEVWNRSASRGTLFGEAEVRSSARVALVGETVARELFQGADPIGLQIRIGTVPFEVIGVLESIGTDLHGWDRDNEVIVPYTTAMRRIMNVDNIGSAKLLAVSDAEIETSVNAIEALLRERHALAEDEPNDFSMFTPVQVQQMVGSMNRIFTLFLPIVAGVSLLIGGIVVANLMIMGVNERRGEIGLRKAVGAREKDIHSQFLLESSLVTVVGGLLALIVAAAALTFVARAMEFPSIMPWEAAVLGLGAAVLVGLVAGAIPARKAAALDSASTLRE